MAKRFIDTGLFDDPFIARLSPSAKLLYLYYITKCDNAGLLKLNEPLWLFQTGLKSLESPLKELETRIVRLSEDLFFCPKFIKFQYPDWPDSKFRAATSAMEKLSKLNLDLNSLETLTEDLPKSYGSGNGIGSIKVKKRSEKKSCEPPTENEVKEYATENGYNPDFIWEKMNGYIQNEMKDSHGNPVQNWKLKLNQVWFKPEHKAFKNAADLLGDKRPANMRPSE